MSKELTTISPEGMEIAESYLIFGNIDAVSQQLSLPASRVAEVLNKREVKKFIDTVFLDTGYRNRNNMASLMDEIVESKLIEARESEIFTSKDLLDVLALIHKMRMDEIKALGDADKKATISKQTNVQINDPAAFGTDTNYGNLLNQLINGDK